VHYLISTAVYSTIEQQRLAQAKQSDKTVFIRTAEVENISKSVSTTTKTWNYKIKKRA
jgi:hypothetical protein